MHKFYVMHIWVYMHGVAIAITPVCWPMCLTDVVMPQWAIIMFFVWWECMNMNTYIHLAVMWHSCVHMWHSEYTVCVFQFHVTCLSCSCMSNTNRFYEIEIATHMSIFLCTCIYLLHTLEQHMHAMVHKLCTWRNNDRAVVTRITVIYPWSV